MKHADLMQFRFSTSRDVTIRDNVLISALAGHPRHLSSAGATLTTTATPTSR